MILAIVLSAIVLLGWGLVTEYFFPPANPPVDQGREAAGRCRSPQPGADARRRFAAPRSATARPCSATTPRVRIETPRLAGSINLKGARDRRSRPHRPQRRPSPAIRRRSACSRPAGTPDAYFGSFGWTGEQRPGCPAPTRSGRPSGARLTPATPVTLSWNNGQGQIFQIRLSIDDGYLFAAEQRVDQPRRTARSRCAPYAWSAGPARRAIPTPGPCHVGPMGVFNGAANYDNDYDDVAEAGAAPLRQPRRLARLHRQLLAGGGHSRPGEQCRRRHSATTAPTNSYQADFVAQPDDRRARHGAATYTSHLFAGAKEVELLDSL